MTDPRVQVQEIARGWTKAEYDAAPDMADRLHRRILDLEGVIEMFLTRLDLGDVRLDEQIRAMREALDV